MAARLWACRSYLRFLASNCRWHSPDGSATSVSPEPEKVFLERCSELLTWLRARPEQSLALVTHWGVLKALTGAEFDNCELRTVRLSDLRVRFID